MNQEEIKKILPHRDHMLLIDEAELREGMNFSYRGISPVILLSPVSFSAKFWGRARVSCFPVRQRALPPSLRDWIRCALKTPYIRGMYLKQNVPCSSIRGPSTGQRARAM